MNNGNGTRICTEKADETIAWGKCKKRSRTTAIGRRFAQKKRIKPELGERQKRTQTLVKFPPRYNSGRGFLSSLVINIPSLFIRSFRCYLRLKYLLILEGFSLAANTQAFLSALSAVIRVQNIF